MDYAILRIQKLKSAVAVRNSLKHAFREQETPNADSERTNQNIHVGAKSSQEAIEKFNQGLPLTVRKNAVLALEYLITASPEAMQGKSEKQQNDYFSDALNYLRKTYGAENVFYAGVHRDETTPHLYAYVLPMKDGKLNARHYVGGHKDRLSEIQTEFADTVGAKHGLERGVKGSKARHQEIGKYYAKVNTKTPQIAPFTVPEKSMFEKQDDYSKRVLAEVNKAIKPTFQALTAKATATDDALERAKVLEQKARQEKIERMRQDAVRARDAEKVQKALQEKTAEADMRKGVIQTLVNTIAKGGEVLEQERAKILAHQEKARIEREEQAQKPKDMGFSR